MSNLTTQNSNYGSGGIDTASTLIDLVDDIKAQHVNGPNSAIVQIETILGSGTSLKGTSTDLATRLNQQMDPLGNLIPVGGVIIYGGSTEPAGWALLNGQELSRTVDANLFAVIGTTYGAGDGSTTFNVPNICGRLPMGVGTGAGDGGSGTGLPTGTALTALSRGAWKGSETHLLTGLESGVGQHGHSNPHSHAQRERVLNGGSGGAKTPAPIDNTTGSNGTLVNVSDFFGQIDTGTASSGTADAGPIAAAQPHTIMPPVMGFNFLMRR